ncbi:Extracellular protein [Pseudocercospora fuligena]|uniref:Extracellular protein n=1 Tax=Pseudocercospora fuligena TaxID=685502 RepID=A0A8H6RRX4_9PEZI|nr:Extracellular protein [Pseudocercospora fuligena]
MLLDPKLLLATSAISNAARTTTPHLEVPACPSKGTIEYSRSVPNKTEFPLTQVDLCYSETSIEIDFTAYNETNFFYNSSQTTNDPIYQWEVMETFISLGTNDPKTYLEFEVSPNNVTFNAIIYNPSKNRTEGQPFDTLYLQTPVEDGLVATTELDKDKETWKSSVKIPFGLWNIDDGCGKGTKWRMNFFRTVVSPQTFPDQLLGAWNPPNEASFHITPYFGMVHFV